MDGMTTTVLDRFVRWNLDLDGDLYGDERERLRWYEGAALSYAVQAVVLPWAAAILVWLLGRPAVLPLTVLLVLLILSMSLTPVYVRSRRVDTVPRHWSAKRIFLHALTGLPIVVFAIGVMRAVDPDPSTWHGGVVGAFIGGAIGVVGAALQVRNRRRRDAALVGDED
jgi:hypothetical protein